MGTLPASVTPIPSGDPGVELVWVDLDAPPPELRLDAHRLSPREQRRAERLRFELDRGRYLAAHGVLRCLIAQRVGGDPGALRIEPGPLGKPRLACGADLRFNVSHAGGRALFAFSRGREVGVDVERLRPLPDLESLVGSALSDAERREWRSVAPAAQVEAFLNGWTRKEAFVKALGRGLQLPLASFDVSLAPGRPARLLRADGVADAVERWSLSAFAPDEAHVAALVVERRPAAQAEETRH